MGLIEISDEEREKLNQFRFTAKKDSLKKRADIILQACVCNTEQEIAEKVKCDKRSIQKWIQRYQEFSINGLYNKKGAGAKPKLTHSKIEKVITKNPASFGIPATIWVSTLISIAIIILHGIRVCPRTIRNYLHKMGYSYKRAKVRRPKKQIPCEIKELFPLAKLGKCIVLFLDETCVRLLPDIRAAWVKAGQQLQVLLPPKSWNAAFYVLGAVDLLSGKFLWQIAEKLNQQIVIEFLKTILINFQGYMIYIILDRASYHTGKIIEEFVKNTEALDVRFLPKGSPQLNPVERIWRHVKDRLANYGFKCINSKKQFCAQLLKNLSQTQIRSLTHGWREKYAKNCA